MTGDEKPVLTLDTVTPTTLCVTKGKPLSIARVEIPVFRAVAPGHSGDAAAMRMIVHGTTRNEQALSSGEMRRQLGLKLRADNGCNLVYVMWRLDPKPKLVVSVKSNPGMRTAKECGADGYTNVKPSRSSPLPLIDDGSEHELGAEIAGDVLTAWADGQVAWQGRLPEIARALKGPAGLRSDNLAFDITGFSVDSRAGADAKPRCVVARPAGKPDGDRDRDDQVDESD